MRHVQTNVQSLVNCQVVVLDGMVRDNGLDHRASANPRHRFLGERAYHRGPGSNGSLVAPGDPAATSSCQCGLAHEPIPSTSAGAVTSKTTLPAAAVMLPGPIWAALVIQRALSA
jgi:hypothetical protein